MKLTIVFLFALIASVSYASAAANFQVTSFSCSPSEVVINSIFSCSATIQNTGDSSGNLNTATLYPDSNNWLEDTNYPQSYGQSVNPGNSITITFSSLRATKSGNNGFNKIMLDSVTDTYVADNNEKANIINVAVTISNSASSAAMSNTITTTTEVTAGGNIDVSLSFTSNSGGCSIGSQTNPKAIAGMTDGSKQSRTWTITQGTSGNCRFTIAAAATGTAGVASKTDSQSSTITCTDCPVDSGSSSSSSSGGGAGSGGGGIAKVYVVGKIISGTSHSLELSDGEKANFSISGASHSLLLKSHTNTSATIEIQSEKQTFTLSIGEEAKADVNNDKVNDISVKLKSIEPISGKISIIITGLEGAGTGTAEAGTGSEAKAGEEGKKTPLLSPLPEKTKKVIYIVIGILIAIAIISGIIYFIQRNKRKKTWGER